MKISVSFLKSKYTKEETIKKIEETSCDWIHVDLTDGKFAGEKNYDLTEIKTLLQNTKKPLDVHFMVENPEEELAIFSHLNVIHYILPVEIPEIKKHILWLKEKQKKVGLAISPDTPLETLLPFIKEIDLVLVMSVYPGFGGQKFLEETSNRLTKLQKIRQEENASFLISVDGGINEETIKKVKDKVDAVVTGSYVCMSDNYEEKIAALKKR